jgi:hypothetical protein
MSPINPQTTHVQHGWRTTNCNSAEETINIHDPAYR